MSISAQHTEGQFHVRFSLQGEERAIEIFHNILTRADSDYPFGRRYGWVQQVRFCPQCNSIVWTNPRLNPEDVKVAARQAGVRVKIKHFAPQQKCSKDGKVFVEVIHVDRSIAVMLFRPNGVLLLRQHLEGLRLLPRKILSLPSAEHIPEVTVDQDDIYSTTNSKKVN